MKKIPEDHEVFIIIGQPDEDDLPASLSTSLKQERVVASDRAQALSLILMADSKYNPIAIISLQELKNQVAILEACKSGKLPGLYAMEFLDDFFWESLEQDLDSDDEGSDE